MFIEPFPHEHRDGYIFISITIATPYCGKPFDTNTTTSIEMLENNSRVRIKKVVLKVILPHHCMGFQSLW